MTGKRAQINPKNTKFQTHLSYHLVCEYLDDSTTTCALRFKFLTSHLATITDNYAISKASGVEPRNHRFLSLRIHDVGFKIYNKTFYVVL